MLKEIAADKRRIVDVIFSFTRSHQSYVRITQSRVLQATDKRQTAFAIFCTYHISLWKPLPVKMNLKELASM